MKTVVLLLLVCLGFSCADTDDRNPKVLNLEVNGCFDKFESGIEICLDSIFNDSRCPTGLVCVWEGDALAAFTLRKANTVKRFNLHANKRYQNDTLIEGVVVKLLQVTPYPTADQPVNPDDYRAEISMDQN